jgi:hypothetical protein
MRLLLLLPALVVLPSGDRIGDVSLLPLLGSAAEQDHQNLAILAEIDAIARAKVEFVFVNTCADALNARKIP